MSDHSGEGLDPPVVDQIRALVERDVPADIAAAWLAAGLDTESIVGFHALGLAADQAIDFWGRDINPAQITRTDGGLVFDNIELWQKDPLDQLPEVIVPGTMRVTIWSKPSYSDTPIGAEISMTWDGQRSIEWSAMAGGGMSVMSDVSCSGVAGWPGGNDVYALVHFEEAKYIVTFIDAAPSAAREIWLSLATQLSGILHDALEGGAEDEGYDDWYLEAPDDTCWTVDDVFLRYLAAAGEQETETDFDTWLTHAVADGTFTASEEE